MQVGDTGALDEAAAAHFASAYNAIEARNCVCPGVREGAASFFQSGLPWEPLCEHEHPSTCCHPITASAGGGELRGPQGEVHQENQGQAETHHAGGPAGGEASRVLRRRLARRLRGAPTLGRSGRERQRAGSHAPRGSILLSPAASAQRASTEFFAPAQPMDCGLSRGHPACMKQAVCAGARPHFFARAVQRLRACWRGRARGRPSARPAPARLCADRGRAAVAIPRAPAARVRSRAQDARVRGSDRARIAPMPAHALCARGGARARSRAARRARGVRRTLRTHAA
jgi:hypothetical protein